MRNLKWEGLAVIAAASAVLLAGAAGAADPAGGNAQEKPGPARTAATPHKPAMTAEQLIASAASAAPAKVGKAATVVTMDADGKMHTLRKGTNGFTCMPDNPATPGPDPMCMDANAMEWLHAYLTHGSPPAGKVGLMYMLAGGTDASNTDPYAAQPTATNHWIKTGPHIMVVGGDSAFYDSYPKSADPDTAAPYIMWSGTPYQHLMAPVK